MAMRVEIITVGDELLWGQTPDTNSVFLGRKLDQLGLTPRWRTTVGDRPEEIRQAVILAVKRADVILMIGGLGSTEDDLTRSAVAQALGRRLVLDEHVLQIIRERIAHLGGRMLTAHQSLALLPQGSKILPNPQGLAPGLLLETAGKAIYLLPGVPLEMQAIFEEEVAPALMNAPRDKLIRRRRLRMAGIGETAISEMLRGIRIRDVRLSYLPQPWGVDLWLSASSPLSQEAEALLSRAAKQIENRLEGHIYGVDEDTLERVVATLLIMRGMTIAVAESCTGGLLANRLTDVPGSSAYFDRGVVAYSNRAKREVLKVPKRILDRFGSVSQETAVAMAEGVRKISGTDLGLSTTGIAGPTGATVEKPVGLAFVGLARQDGASAQKFLFGKDRKTNKECCLRAALNMVRQHLLNL